MKTKNQSQKDKGGTALGKDGNLTHEPVTNNAMVSRHGGGETSSDTLKSDDEIKNKVISWINKNNELDYEKVIKKAISLTREACEKELEQWKKGKFYNKIEVHEEIKLPKELIEHIEQRGQKAERQRILEIIDRHVFMKEEEDEDVLSITSVELMKKEIEK